MYGGSSRELPLWAPRRGSRREDSGYSINGVSGQFSRILNTINHAAYTTMEKSTIHCGTMASPGLFYLVVSLRTQTDTTIQCLTTPMYCSIDASTGGGEGLDAIRIVSDCFSNRYGHLPRRHTRRIAASTGGLYADAIGAMQNTATPTSIRLSFDCAKTIRRHSGRRRDAEYHTAYSPNPKEGKG